MFNEARAADYRELAAACQDTLARHRKKNAPELASEFAKLKQRFRDIKKIDYFNAPAALTAQMWLDQMEKALAPKQGVVAAQKLDPRQFVGKVWLTRPRPGIDRAGSAWLLRKFIDPKAEFVFDIEPAKQPHAVPFDMADVEFSHHGDDCTFETFVKRFEVADKAVLRMAEMVHDADLEDQKFQRCECIGINAVLTGWARTSMSDSELLEKGIACFEGLYQLLRK